MRSIAFAPTGTSTTRCDSRVFWFPALLVRGFRTHGPHVMIRSSIARYYGALAPMTCPAFITLWALCAFTAACAPASVPHIEAPLRASDGLECQAYVLSGREPVTDVFLSMGGT